MKIVWIATAYFAGLTVGNLIWQAMTQRDWGVAVERSYFQLIAILGLIVLIGVVSRLSKN